MLVGCSRQGSTEPFGHRRRNTVVLARPTGRTYAMDFVHLVTVVDGKVRRFREFFDTWAAAEAFRAE